MEDIELKALVSAAGDCANDEQRFFAGHHFVRERGVRRLVGDVLLAREKPQEWPPRLRHVVANRPLQHRIVRLKGVQHGTHGHWAWNLQLDLATDLREPSKVRRQHHAYLGLRGLSCRCAPHFSVCTSTESTAGKSRTMGDQLSPASEEQ